MKKVNWINLDDGKIKGVEFFIVLSQIIPALKSLLSLAELRHDHENMEIFADYCNKQIQSRSLSESIS